MVRLAETGLGRRAHTLTNVATPHVRRPMKRAAPTLSAKRASCSSADQGGGKPPSVTAVDKGSTRTYRTYRF